VTQNNRILELVLKDKIMKVFCQQPVVEIITLWGLAMVALVDDKYTESGGKYFTQGIPIIG
jgi:hypothetical protein